MRPEAHEAPRDGLAARRFAVMILDDVLRRRLSPDDSMAALQADPAFMAVSPADRALLRAILMVALRRLGTIRCAIADRLRLGVPDKSGPFQSLLIIGATQVLFLDVPDHAAVDTTITLMREDRRSDRYANLGNAVMRRLIQEKPAILAKLETGPETGLDTPPWLLARWRKTYGDATALAIARMHTLEPTLDVSVKSDVALWASRLDGMPMGGNSIRLRSHAPIVSLPGFNEGDWWVQDAAAALPARILNVKAGERVLDLCAAPGGKTAQLAMTGARVVAVDRSGARMQRLGENMARLGLDVEAHVADAVTFAAEPFDAVLLDAPCSATGTIRRHPDVAHTKAETDIVKLASLQGRLLDHAATLVKKGGRLVYATCSLEPEEGEAQVHAFLTRTPDFHLEPIEAHDLPGFEESVTPYGALRVLPCHRPHEEARLAGLDGFYAARLCRSS